MRKIYLLFSHCILITSCEKEELRTDTEEIENKNENEDVAEITSINLHILPDEIQSFLNNKKGQNKNSLAQVISDSVGKKYTDKDGNISYTFNYSNSSLKEDIHTKNSADFFFENLLIKENKKDEPSYYVVRYHPEEKWWQQSKDFRAYSGKITFYTLKGTSLGTVGFIDGKPVEQENKSCNLTMYAGDVICSSGTHSDGSNYGWYCEQTYEYKIHCTGGGTGEYPDYGTPSGDGDGGSGGSSGGDSGGDDPAGLPDTGGGFVPDIPDDEEEIIFKVQNNIDDPCASIIFNQLTLMSMDHNLPPDVSYDNINGMETDLDFSNAILNLFNDSNEFDYFISEDSSLPVETNARTKPEAVYNPNTDRWEVFTDFNPDYFDDATDLSMARTMIHESVHAYLVYIQRGDPYGNMMDALEAYIAENELSNTVDNNLHHNFMAQFIDAVAYQLWEWDINHGTGGTLGWQYYQDVSWGGLAKDPDNPNSYYDEFNDYLDDIVEDLNGNNDLRNQIKSRILDRIDDEQENTSVSSQNGEGNNCQ